jgi:hypothetical protein
VIVAASGLLCAFRFTTVSASPSPASLKNCFCEAYPVIPAGRRFFFCAARAGIPFSAIKGNIAPGE